MLLSIFQYRALVIPYVISIILKVASILPATSESIFNTSVACNTILLPDIISNELVEGMGVSFVIKTVSFVSVSLVSLSIFTSTVLCEESLLHNNKPRTIVVVERTSI